MNPGGRFLYLGLWGPGQSKTDPERETASGEAACRLQLRPRFSFSTGHHIPVVWGLNKLLIAYCGMPNKSIDAYESEAKSEANSEDEGETQKDSTSRQDAARASAG